MPVVRERKDFETAIVANKWEDLRPCYKNDDISSKLIVMVLSKYNPAISDNDKYNDLIKLEENSKLYGVTHEIKQRMPVVSFNEAQVDYIFNIANSTNPAMKRKQIKKAVAKLSSERIILQDGMAIEIYGVFPFIHYDPNDKVNTLVAEFNYRLLPYVLDLRNQTWTVSYLNDIRCLSSDYAIRLYHLCLRYDKIRPNPNDYKREIDATRLREHLNISKGYSTVNFHLRILKKYLEEISNKTSINVSYDTVNIGRKIVKYVFHITFKNAISEPRKEYADGFAGRGLDDTLVNRDNVELLDHLQKMGVNKKQIVTVTKHGTSYLKYVVENVDNYYNKVTSKDLAYYKDNKYYSLIDNKVIRYGALFGGAIKEGGWLNYTDWANEHKEAIEQDKQRAIELSNLKAIEDEKLIAEQEQKERRERLRESSTMFANMSDEALDNMLAVYDKDKAERERLKAEEEKKKAIDLAARKELEAGNTKAVKPIVIDSIQRANYDVNMLLSSPFKAFFIEEQCRLGYKDFADFVHDVRVGVLS